MKTVFEESDPWIRTYSGRSSTFSTRSPKRLIPVDIAHALSQLCRWTGHCKEFFSVAQHCILVASVVPHEDRAWALLHDASEAYCNDINRPLKQALPDYKAVEAVVERTIFERFGLYGERPDSIKPADNLILATEARDLCGVNPEDWGLMEPLKEKITPWSMGVACSQYLKLLDAYNREGIINLDA